MKPIFFAWTRSFWASFAGMAILLFGSSPDVLLGLGQVVAFAFDVDPVKTGQAIVRVAPFVLWAFALQQRSGAARPYTLDPRALK